MFSIIKLHLLILISGLFVPQLSGQSSITWDVLADVDFEEILLEDTDTYWLVPTFGETVKLYENQEITIEGYLIPIDIEENFCILSKNPYSSCFFCGAAGIETIVELQFQKPLKSVQMDQKARVTGQLKLNKNDFEHFNYILTKARLIYN